jgi:cytochrome c553
MSCSTQPKEKTVSTEPTLTSVNEELEVAKGIIKRFNKSESTVDVDKLFKERCVVCHGVKGNLGINGAGDLTTSGLNLEDRVARIYFGRNAMTPFKDVLTEDEIVELALFVALLRQE